MEKLTVVLLMVLFFIFGMVLGIGFVLRDYDKSISEGNPIVVTNGIYICHKIKVE